jgi:hypothetical protein
VIICTVVQPAAYNRRALIRSFQQTGIPHGAWQPAGSDKLPSRLSMLYISIVYTIIHCNIYRHLTALAAEWSSRQRILSYVNSRKIKYLTLRMYHSVDYNEKQYLCSNCRARQIDGLNLLLTANRNKCQFRLLHESAISSQMARHHNMHRIRSILVQKN